METGTGHLPISPRIVLGALIIKHIESLDDRGTIAIIQENPYMHYFLGDWSMGNQIPNMHGKNHFQTDQSRHSGFMKSSGKTEHPTNRKKWI